MRFNKVLAVVLTSAITMTSAFFPVKPYVSDFNQTELTVDAEESETSGKLGENASWNLSAEGVLTISGTGEIPDYESEESPFYNRADVKSAIIKNGITSIGSNTFEYCKNLETITIPDSVKCIGIYAFSETLLLKNQTGIKYVDAWAVACDNDIESATIKDGTKGICDGLFQYCKYLKSVTIPESVLYIGSCSFLGCTNLKSIEIPDSVTKIGKNVFVSCEKLQSVKIGNGVADIKSDTFNLCKNLENLVIGDSIESIGGYAFAYCEKLKNITMGKNITSIGAYSFYNCKSLRNITIPNSVTSIEKYAFRSCQSLVSIVLPENVNYIGQGAFCNCKSLESIVIKNSGCKIYGYDDTICNEYNFNNYESSFAGTIYGDYKHVDYRDNWRYPYDYAKDWKYNFKYIGEYQEPVTEPVVTTITTTNTTITTTTIITTTTTVTTTGINAGEVFSYDDCTYSIIDVNKLTVLLIGCDKKRSGSIIIPKKLSYKNKTFTLTEIGSNAFWCCYDITDITLPDSIVNIDDMAFYYCTGLKKINIPNSVKNIGYRAFRQCENLHDITIPDNVEKIGAAAFSSCPGLTSVVIGSNVNQIGEQAFHYCTGLKNIKVLENNNYYTSEDDVLFNKNKTKLIQYPAGNERTEYKVPDTVVYIEETAFYKCANLKSIIIDDFAISIGDNAFSECNKLNNIIIPDSMVSIGKFAFYNTPWLLIKQKENPLVILNSILIDGTTCKDDDIVIPDTVKAIGDAAFYDKRDKFKSVIVPENVEKIEKNAFSYCGEADVIILNPECVIYDAVDTIFTGYTYDNKPVFDGVIYGYNGSTAQSYAEKYGYTFKAIDENAPPITSEPEETTAVTSTEETTTTTTTTTVTKPEQQETKVGDIDGDGEITLKDAVLIRRFIVGGWNVNVDIKAADLDGDGEITLKDAVLIRRYIVGGWNVEIN